MASDNKNWITAADVARHAGVSRSAVSRTFTPGASVSKQTRQRVLASASELGYQVNIIARTMITGSSNFVGIITSSFENPFMSRLLGSLIHQLTLHGLMPLLLNINGLHQLEPALRRLLSYHITGVIMTSGAPPLALAREYLAKKIPVVLINRYACLPGIDRICSDNEQGASLVAALFREENLQRLAFIGENRHSFNTAERWRVFRAALPATPPRRPLLRSGQLSVRLGSRGEARERTAGSTGHILRQRCPGNGGNGLSAPVAAERCNQSGRV